MKTIDTRGRACPEPLILTKKAIAGVGPHDVLEVLSDNPTSRDNVVSYLKAMGISPACTEQNGVSHIVFSPGNASLPEAEPVCPAPEVATAGYAVVIRSQVMGTGDDELGRLLMRSCINSLEELDALPSIVVLYNSGVMLALEGTDTAKSLIALSLKGVEIIVCGTCIDFYEVRPRLAVGTVTNMLAINNTLIRASRILYP